MNAFVAEQWAAWHQQDLLDEASQERLAAIARGHGNDPLPRDRGGSDWRRQIGSALIDLRAWLSGGHAESARGRG